MLTVNDNYAQTKKCKTMTELYMEEISAKTKKIGRPPNTTKTEKIIQLRKEGFTNEEIAKYTGTSYYSVAQLFRRGIRNTPFDYDAAFTQQLIRETRIYNAYCNNPDFKKIAKTFQSFQKHVEKVVWKLNREYKIVKLIRARIPRRKICSLVNCSQSTIHETIKRNSLRRKANEQAGIY